MQERVQDKIDAVSLVSFVLYLRRHVFRSVIDGRYYYKRR